MRDPYQAEEAAAFVLTIQPGRPPTDTTLDMFAVPADQVADLVARCAPRTSQDASGSATSDFLTPGISSYQLIPENATSAPLTRRYADLKLGDAFSFLEDGLTYIRCRGGYRPGCGGDLVAFNYADCPVHMRSERIANV